MLPVALGANGHPPIPPVLASSAAAPRSYAARAFTYPVFRVLWKCQRSATPGAWVPATSASAWTCAGTPTPMVSPNAISSGSAWTHRSSTAATRSAGTAPSNGQPKAADNVRVRRRPAIWARWAIRSQAPMASSTLTPWLRRLNSSVTITTTFTSSSPAARARSSPRSLRTSPIHETAPRGSRAATASASASCGTRFGLTKLTASIRRTPLATRESISQSLSSVDSTVCSFCSPSRGATSTISTLPVMTSPYTSWSDPVDTRRCDRRFDTMRQPSPMINATPSSGPRLATSSCSGEYVRSAS